MIEVIEEKKAWQDIISSAKDSDFYHTYDYHQLSKGSGENPLLVKYSEKDKAVAFPLMFRDVKGTPYKDATSVYGYPGPISINLADGFDNSQFKSEMQEFFRAYNLVSLFSRLNPYIPNQENVLKELGEISDCGLVVNIDLSLSEADQRLNYSKRLKTYVNKARRFCMVKKAETKEEVMAFIEMYYDNMHRVKAKPKYFFEKEYFFKLLESRLFKTDILLAVLKESGEIISGAMFIQKSKIIQYHLAGTKKKFLHLNPLKLLIDEMRICATQNGLKHFNLGGGVGSQKDSLFIFKSKFSKDYKTFKLWKHIVDEKIYKELVHEKFLESGNENKELCSKFFPLYR